MIYTIGITISGFLGLILLTKKNKTTSDKILAVWLLVIACHLSLFAILITKSYLTFPYVLGLEKPIALLHGPLIYLYTVSLTSPSSINRKSFLHFIPFLLSIASMISFLLLSPDKKLIAYQNNGEGYVLLLALTLGATILSGIIYCALSFQNLIMHKKKIKENFSYSEKINLQWLSILIIGISCIWLSVIYGNDELTFTAVIIYVLYIGFFGIKQVGIFHSSYNYALPHKNEIEESALDIANSDDEKYEKSRLGNLQLQAIHEKLNELMKKEKLHLTPELSLAMVAEQLNIHPNTLSEVINRAEQKNFFDYINTLRVKEFKERVLMPENQKYTLLSLAFECGFNSKTAFNRNFKNVTGKSPSQFLKESNIALK